MSERSFRRDRRRRIAVAKRREALRARKVAAAAVAAGAFALGAPAASSAASFTVNSTGDTGATTCAPDPSATTCELRDAINKAAATSDGPDEITFDSTITGDTITLNSGRLVVDDNDPLNISGGSAADSIYVDGNYASMVFDVQDTYYSPDNSGLTISGMTIQNGESYYYSGAPYAAGAAGGLYATRGTKLTLANTVVTGNTAGGIYLGAYTWAGGGGVANLGSMTVQDSTIYNNYADTYRPTTFAYGGGGGVDNLGRLTISGSQIDDNGSSGYGGGILNGISKYPTSLDVSDSTVTSNGAPYGGGIASFNFPATIGSGHGRIENSTISGNGALLGGGIGSKYLGGSQHWQVSQTTVSGNESALGGGLYLGSVLGSFELLDSTISGNYAAVRGGGGYLGSGAQKYEGAVEFNNSTIASNEASDDGGGLYLDYANPAYMPASIPLFSTIVGSNTANGGLNDLAEATGSGGAFDLSFSLIRAAGNASLTQTPAGSSIIGADPQLGALASNGGPTETQLPSVNSPVVDKGSAPGNLTTDQRGDPRTVDTSVANANDGTDIGSVELSNGPPGPTPAATTPVTAKKKKCKKKKKKSSAQIAKKKCKKKKK